MTLAGVSPAPLTLDAASLGRRFKDWPDVRTDIPCYG